MKLKHLYLTFLILLLFFSGIVIFPISRVQANPDTLTLRPNAGGTYNQFVEVPNSGFLYGDQFESGSFSAWTGTSIGSGTQLNVSLDYAYQGIYSVKANKTGAGGGVKDYCYKDLGTTYTTLFCRFYVYISSWLATTRSVNFLLFKQSESVGMYDLGVVGTGNGNAPKLQTLGTGAATSATTVSLATWTCLEFEIIIGSGTGEIHVWKNGEEVTDLKKTGLTNTGHVIQVITMGMDDQYFSSNENATVYEDSVVVSTSYIGPENHPNLVNDSSDNTALQVTANTTQKETENLADTAQTGTINSVTVDMRAEASTTSLQAVTLTRTYSTDYEGSTTTISSTAFTDYTTVYSTNPNTGVAWTWAEVNALEVGARASTLPSGTIQFSEFYIIVDYQSDVTPPTYSRISTNTTLANNPCSFNCLISDDTNVSTYIFSTNNTGTWTNDTVTTFSNFFNTTAAWANVTKTLNDTIGNVVSYMWYANDTSDNWSSSEQYNFTARERPNLQITPDNVTCRKYLETFNVQINVTNAVDIQAFNFTIYYDPSLLNCSSVTSGELAQAFTVTFDTANGILDGKMAGSPINGNHWLLNITFQAAEGLIWKEGLANKLESRIWFHQAEVGFSDDSTLQYVVGGVNQITVNQMAYTFLPVRGDVNNDGTVNIQDIRTVAAYYGKTLADPEWPEAAKYDLTNDNTIDIFDLILVATNFGFTYP